MAGVFERLTRGMERLFPTPESQFRLEVERLQAIPRHQAGVSSLLGPPLRFVDSATLLIGYGELMVNGQYRFESSEARPYIIDAGANIGLGIIYLKRLFPEAEVIAFEPDPDIFAALSANVSSFGLTDVSLVNEAVWTGTSTVAFRKEGAYGGRIALPGDTEHFSVATTSLKPFLSKPVELLKLDIEGAECAVIDDIRDGLDGVRRLFVEYHGQAGQPQQLDALLGTLRRSGFRYYLKEAWVPREPFVSTGALDGMDLQLNIFAVRGT